MKQQLEKAKNEFEALVLEMQSWKPEERALALKECLFRTAEQVKRMAAIVAAMDEAGDDMSGLPSWWLSQMRKIRGAQMLAETFVEYEGLLRKKVCELPIEDQRQLIAGRKMELLLLLPDGKTDTLLVDPRKLEPIQIHQIFGRGFIRDAAEQRSWLEANPKSAEGLKVEPEVKVNRKEGCVFIGHLRLDRKDLLRLLEQLS